MTTMSAAVDSCDDSKNRRERVDVHDTGRLPARDRAPSLDQQVALVHAVGARRCRRWAAGGLRRDTRCRRREQRLHAEQQRGRP